jgi:hypothetical protein
MAHHPSNWVQVKKLTRPVDRKKLLPTHLRPLKYLINLVVDKCGITRIMGARGIDIQKQYHLKTENSYNLGVKTI